MSSFGTKGSKNPGEKEDRGGYFYETEGVSIDCQWLEK
jgi:hypothetical protein